MSVDSAELAFALRWCVKNGYDIPTVMGACASVGIEHNKDTSQMLIDFVRAKTSANEREHKE